MSSGFEVIGEYFVIPGLRGACHEAPIGAFQWTDLSARSGRFVEPDQAGATCPVPLAKIFMFSFDPNHLHVARVPAHTQGAFRDRHERRARGAMDAGGAADESAYLRTAKSCGPDASTPASSLAEVSARRQRNQPRELHEMNNVRISINWRSIRSEHCRSTQFNRRTRAIPALPWRWHRWSIRSGTGS